MPKITQILSMGFFRTLEFETTNKMFISLFVEMFNYNNKIDAVSWADHNFFSTKSSIKTLSVDSNSTDLKIPWTKFELPVPLNNGKVTF